METERQAGASRLASPWVQLVFGVVCMAMIANLQYGWTLFVNPIDDKYGWGRAAIQVAFTIFVVTETWLVPIEGYSSTGSARASCLRRRPAVRHRLGHQLRTPASLPMLYVAAAIGGVGAGAVYGTCVGNALKWFPDRRGLAAGMTAAGFGAGSALTIMPIANMIKASGYEAAFLCFGIGQGVDRVPARRWLLRAPEAGRVARRRSAPRSRQQTRARLHARCEMCATPVFWLMYLMFVAGGGRRPDGDRAARRRSRRTSRSPTRPCRILGLTLPALTFALAIDRVLNGADAAVLRLGVGPHRPRADDVHRVRARRASASWCCHVRPQTRWRSSCSRAWCSSPGARSTASSRRPAPTPSARSTRPPTPACCTRPRARPRCWCRSPASLTTATGSWHAVFTLAAGMAALSALLAIFVLKPMRHAHVQKHSRASVDMQYGSPIKD